MIPSNNVVIQKAWVVTDVEEAALSWSKALNIGPFFLAEFTPQVFSQVSYRGQESSLHMKTAIGFVDGVQIELVEPVGDSPSAFRDVFAQGQAGFHHLCFWSDDFDADMSHYTNQGFAIANQGQVVGGGPRFAYLDAMASLGSMIELLERKPSTEQTFQKWQDIAKAWTPDQDVIVKP